MRCPRYEKIGAVYHTREIRGIVLANLSIGARWSSVIDVTLRPLYPHERTQAPTHWKGGWTPQPVWTFWKKEKSLASAGIWTLDPPARILVGLLTALSRLVRVYKSATNKRYKVQLNHLGFLYFFIHWFTASSFKYVGVLNECDNKMEWLNKELVVA
jgi:hypothetical protein